MSEQTNSNVIKRHYHLIVERCNFIMLLLKLRRLLIAFLHNGILYTSLFVMLHANHYQFDALATTCALIINYLILYNINLRSS